MNKVVENHAKQFAARAIMVLKEQGNLSTGDALSKYLPDFPEADQTAIADILHHTSGVPELTAIEAFYSNQAKDWTPRKILAMFNTQH